MSKFYQVLFMQTRRKTSRHGHVLEAPLDSCPRVAGFKILNIQWYLLLGWLFISYFWVSNTAAEYWVRPWILHKQKLYHYYFTLFLVYFIANFVYCGIIKCLQTYRIKHIQVLFDSNGCKRFLLFHKKFTAPHNIMIYHVEFVMDIYKK